VAINSRMIDLECRFPSETISKRLFPVSTTCSGERSSDHAGHGMTHVRQTRYRSSKWGT
jgi:hypothetical protein